MSEPTSDGVFLFVASLLVVSCLTAVFAQSYRSIGAGIVFAAIVGAVESSEWRDAWKSKHR